MDPSWINSISLEQLSQMVSALSNIVVAIAAIIAALYATKGVNSYRNEFLVKDQYELAKRVIHAIYKVRDGFSYVRHPFMSVAEYPNDDSSTSNDASGIETTSDADSPRKHYRSVSFAYEKRWAVLTTALRELESELIQAQVFWGPEIGKLIVPVKECAVSLQIAIENRLRMILGEEGITDKSERKILYSTGDITKDPYGQEVQEALNPIEAMVRPHLRPARNSSAQ